MSQIDSDRPRLLLTGATGFIGRQVLPHLGTFDLHCTSRDCDSPGKQLSRNFTWHEADLRDADQCRRLVTDVRPDYLVHLAWNTEQDRFWEAADNDDWLEGGRALCRAFAASGGMRLVVAGSCAEYAGHGAEPRREIEDELDALPATRYGRAKLELLRSLRELNVQHAWARVFFPYGSGEGERRLVPSIARALLRGEPAECSSGRAIRDFIDVRELGRALAMLVTSDVRGSINLGQGESTRIADIANLLGELAGRPDLIRLGARADRPNEPELLVPDLERQRSLLGFAPRISLREGLAAALGWWSVRQSPNNTYSEAIVHGG
jgi:nucleoside-diphosphate-sugar epimerase